MIGLLVQSLALARLLRLFTEEDGPFGILATFRRLIGIDDEYGVVRKDLGKVREELGGLFSCFLCLGIWLVPLIVLLYSNPYTYWIVWCLAVAQGASFIYATMDRILN